MTEGPRYHLEHGDGAVRTVEKIHDGTGPIRVRSFFSGLTASGVNLHVWELPPGSSEGRHTHRRDATDDAYEEIYYVLEGTGTMQIDGDNVPLRRGDAVLVPVGVDHGITASGDVTLRVAIVFTLVG